MFTGTKISLYIKVTFLFLSWTYLYSYSWRLCHMLHRLRGKFKLAKDHKSCHMLNSLSRTIQNEINDYNEIKWLSQTIFYVYCIFMYLLFFVIFMSYREVKALAVDRRAWKLLHRQQQTHNFLKNKNNVKQIDTERK